MRITDDDKRMLGQLTTRDEAGRHFTLVYPDEWLERMEAAGHISIDRPVHEATGIPYDRQYWTVTVADTVADWFDHQGRLYTD